LLIYTSFNFSGSVGALTLATCLGGDEVSCSRDELLSSGTSAYAELV